MLYAFYKGRNSENQVAQNQLAVIQERQCSEDGTEKKK